MIVYDYNSTAILVEPIKNQCKQEILRTYSKLHKYLMDRQLKPQLPKLDNKCSAALKQFMRTAKVDFQLVPPYHHRQNAAERAIGIWKDHFVAGLASLDPHFPMHFWCRLINQCTQTLNLMRPSCINPRLSAEAQRNRAFDNNKTPLAPPSTKVLIHETPNCRQTWASMVLMDGIQAEHRNTTGATKSMPPKPEPNASPALRSFFPVTAK
jgi:hypothetical protein